MIQQLKTIFIFPIIRLWKLSCYSNNSILAMAIKKNKKHPFYIQRLMFLTFLQSFTKLQHVFLWLSLQSHHRVTDEAFWAKTSKYGPSTLLRMSSLLLKEQSFVFLFAFTAAGVVQYGSCKRSPRTSTIVQFIFHFWSFEISKRILRNPNLIIGLDSYSRRFIYLDPILIYISLWINCLFEIH